MHTFIFWCLAGLILDMLWMAEGTRVKEEVLDASAEDRPIFSKTLEMRSLKDERGLLVQESSHRRRRNLGIGSLNTTTTPLKLERYTTVSATLPAGSNPPLPFNITCYEDYSCKGRCTLERDNGTTKDEAHSCFCDPYCNSFKDCCADFDQFCKEVPTKQLDDKWGCHNGKRMIDSCPANYTLIDVITKCENPRELSSSNYADVTPVISTTGKMYRNQHCALCNGVKNQNMQSLSYNFISCQLTPPDSYSVKQKLAFLFDYCDVVRLTTVGEQRVRGCTNIRDGPGYCSAGESEKKACQKGPHRVVSSQTSAANYKNVHCARCQGESDDFLTCGSITQGLGSLHGKPFTAILDIGGADNTPKSINTEATCGRDHVYDPFLETCRKAIQFPSQKYSPKLNKYNIAMWIETSRKNKRAIYHYPTVEIFKSMAKLFGLKPQVFQLVERENVYASPPMAVLVVNLYIEKNTTKRARRDDPSSKISIDLLLNFTRPFDFSIAVDNFTVIKATSRLLTCVRVQYFTSEEYVVVQGSSSIYINQTRELLSERQYVANSTKIHNGLRLPLGLIAVCRRHLPSIFTCNGTYIGLSTDEYVMLPNNSIYRNVSNTVYNQGKYSIMNGSVVVCTEYPNKYTKTRPTDEWKNYAVLRLLTNIGLSLSVVCLVFVLVTYTLFGELRTLPGINLMNLSSALLVAHLLWLIGSDKTGSNGACVAIAVLLHYLFLVSFVWMSIIAFSTWKAFSSTGCVGSRSSDKEYRRRKICQSLAIGWLPVLSLVLICLALDQSGAVEIKYAGPKGCWINNGFANLFVFILPLAASVVWNAVFFGLTVNAIYKTKKQARMVTEQRENQRNFSIYIKIAVLMGFTWIFGFLALMKSTYFGYPFVVFNTIQGVYIAFAFTFNSRTMKLYRSRFISPNTTRRAARSTNKYTKHSTTNTHV